MTSKLQCRSQFLDDPQNQEQPIDMEEQTSPSYHDEMSNIYKIVSQQMYPQVKGVKKF